MRRFSLFPISSAPKAHLPLLIMLFLLSTWLGARGLNADSIWIDEYWSIYNAGGAHYGPLSPVQIFQRIADEDIWHVPLYYLLIAGWGNLVGWSQVALRAFSLLIGVVSVAMAYRLGKDVHSPLAGLGAAVAVGTSAFYLYYFHELRGYTLNVLLAMILLRSYWKSLHRIPPQPSANRVSRLITRHASLVTFFCAVLAILYTHYLITIILMALGSYHLLFVRKDRRWWQITGAALLAVVLFMPWLAITLDAWRQASEPSNVALRDWGPGVLKINVLLLVAFGSGSLVLPLIAGWFALHDENMNRKGAKKTPSQEYGTEPNRQDAEITAHPLPIAPPHSIGRGWGTLSPHHFAFVLLITTLGFALIFNLLISLFVVMRYLLPVWAILALIVGIGTAKLHQRGFPVGVWLGVWVIAGVWSSLDPNFITSYIDQRVLSKTPWHEIAPALAPRAQTEDTMMYLLPDETWYVWQEWVTGYYLHDIQERGVHTALIESRRPYTSDRDYRQIAKAQTSPRIWLGYATDKPPLAWYALAPALTETYALCDVALTLPDFPYQIDLYTRIPEATVYLIGSQVGITLVEPLRVEAGQLRVMTGVSIGEAINPQAYSVGLHLVDVNGITVQQVDFGLVVPNTPFNPYRCTQASLDVSGLAAGTYSLDALVYDWQTLDRLPVTDSDDNRLLLETITIP